MLLAKTLAIMVLIPTMANFGQYTWANINDEDLTGMIIIVHVVKCFYIVAYIPGLV